MSDWIAGMLATIAERSREHGVDPWIFGILYIGSIPPYFLSIAWLMRRLTRRQPATTAWLSTGFFFILPMAYVAMFGRNLPLWVYAVILGMIVLGGILGLAQVASSPKRLGDRRAGQLMPRSACLSPRHRL